MSAFWKSFDLESNKRAIATFKFHKFAYWMSYFSTNLKWDFGSLLEVECCSSTAGMLHGTFEIDSLNICKDLFWVIFFFSNALADFLSTSSLPS